MLSKIYIRSTQLITIVDFELATINHNRRLEKQNEDIIEFYRTPNSRKIVGRIALICTAIVFIAIQIGIIINLKPR